MRGEKVPREKLLKVLQSLEATGVPPIPTTPAPNK